MSDRMAVLLGLSSGVIVLYLIAFLATWMCMIEDRQAKYAGKPGGPVRHIGRLVGDLFMCGVRDTFVCAWDVLLHTPPDMHPGLNAYERTTLHRIEEQSAVIKDLREWCIQEKERLKQ